MAIDKNNPKANKGNDPVVRQGHTAGPYGNDPNLKAKGVAGDKPRELKG